MSTLLRNLIWLGAALIVAMRRQYSGFFAPYDHVYDPLLDDFEPGMPTEKVRSVFAALRPTFSYQQIADILNMRGERTRYGKPWTDVAVLRACRRLGIGSTLEH